ncbi:MAG: hypothetical protein QXI35_07945 [Candidatus Nezhaarchaeales archaeon]
MYFYHIFLLPHWGLLINHYGFNKSRPVINFIPPTTIIGALSYPLNKLLKRPEQYQEHSGAELYRRIFRSINVKLPLFSAYYDLSRVAFMYRGKAEFDAVAVGKLYKASQESPIEVIIVVEEGPAEKLLGPKWKDLLRAACCSINRIGARESIITPIEVREGTPELISDRVVRTKFSFPAYLIKNVSGSYVAGEVVDWRVVEIGPYVGKKTVGYITPLPTPSSKGEVEVELAEGYNACKCGEEVIIPWYQLKSLLSYHLEVY